MDKKRLKRAAVLEAAIYERVAQTVEALLFPPSLRDVVGGMGNSRTGVDAHIQENGMLELQAVADSPEAARRALGLGVREAKLLAERLRLSLTQDAPPAVVRFDEAGREWAAFTRYRLTESAAWPGRAPDGWSVVPGPVVERVEGDDRGRIVYHGQAIKPYMLYVYAGGATTPQAITAFESVQEATGAFKPMLDRVKAKADTSVAEMFQRRQEAYSPQLQAQLERYAKSDLAKAKNEGDIIIARTKKGNVTVSHENGIYTLMAQGRTLYKGPAAGAVPVIVGLYDVRS